MNPEYTEGDQDSSITGIPMLWEDTSNTLRVPSATKPLPIDIKSGASEGLANPVTTTLTLTTADTAYKLPANELANRKLLVIYNASDADVFIGSSSVTTTNGILLEAGGVMTIDSKSDLYAVCGTDSKTINLLEMS